MDLDMAEGTTLSCLAASARDAVSTVRTQLSVDVYQSISAPYLGDLDQDRSLSQWRDSIAFRSRKMENTPPMTISSANTMNAQGRLRAIFTIHTSGAPDSGGGQPL